MKNIKVEAGLEVERNSKAVSLLRKSLGEFDFF